MSIGQEIRTSLGKFVLAMNRQYKYVRFHQDVIIPALEAVERGEIRKLMLNMPPRHGKSDIVTLNFIPWWLGRHPKGNAMVASYSYELAKDFGSKIKARMSDELYCKIFPQATLSRDIRARNFLRTISGGSFYAMGFDGAMSGKGINLAVLDDAIKNHEEAESESRQEFLMDIYESTIRARLEPSPDGFAPAMVVAMTRWHMRDFCARLVQKEGRVEDGGEWTVLSIPAEQNGEYLWADRFGAEHYAKIKNDDDTWSALYQQQPGAAQSFWFKESWLNFYDIPPPRKYNTYLICDPGASKDRKSDRTSIQVWMPGSDRKMFLIDWVLDRMHPGERTKALERLIRRHEPSICLYEEYGLVNDVFYFNEKAERENWSVALIPIGKRGPRHNLSKAQRIDGLKTWFEEGRIILPRKFEYQQVNGQKVDLTQRFLDDEYKLYRGQDSIPHEDDLDCMSRLNEPELVVDWEKLPTEPKGISRRGFAGSWEARY